MLFDQIKEDTYPSVTMMARVEAVSGHDPEPAHRTDALVRSRV